jgi:hypothetical protein
MSALRVNLCAAASIGAVLFGCAHGSSTASGGSADQPNAGAAGPGPGGPAAGSPADGDSATASRFASCEGVDLQQDGALDVDLTAVRVRGRVTVDGAAVPAAAGAGRVTFTNALTKATASADIASDSGYELTLAPGSYDVAYEPDAQACGIPSSLAPPWPCNGHTLQSSVTISSDGALDFDLPTIVVRGAVTLKGGPWPDDVGAAISFASAGSAAGVALVSRGGYTVRIFKGTTSVSYLPQSSFCTTSSPCNGGILRPDVGLQESGALDLDVPMVVMRGAVSLDGTRMQDPAGGAITFAAAGTPTSPASNASVEIEGDGTYAVALLPGTYAVGYSGVPTAGDTSPLPRGPGRLLTDVAVRTDGLLDLDVPTAQVRGAVTVNGTSVPPWGDEALTFTTDGGSASARIHPDGTYATVLVRGTYAIGFAAARACLKDDAYPCNGGVLRTMPVEDTGVFDVDLKTVDVVGKMTLNGAAPPQSSSEATLSFVTAGRKPDAPDDEHGLSAVVDVGPDASYFVRLLAGSYDVYYGGVSCTGGGSAMPCGAGLLHAGAAFDSSGALDVDVASVHVRGKVTLAGQPITDAGELGALTFTGPASGSQASQRLGSKRPVDYQAHLLRGRYVITYAPDEASCGAGASSPLPCVEVVLAGCDHPGPGK